MFWLISINFKIVTKDLYIIYFSHTWNLKNFIKFTKFLVLWGVYEVLSQLGGEWMQEDIELSTGNDRGRIFTRTKSEFIWKGFI